MENNRSDFDSVGLYGIDIRTQKGVKNLPPPPG